MSSRSSYQANCSRTKGKGKSKLYHALRLWCGNAPCTKKEILNGFIKLRCTLGNIFKVRWFQKPAGSLEMHWNESIVQFLMGDLWKKNSNVWHDTGEWPNFLRMECDFSKLPKFQMLTEAYWRYSGLMRWNRGWKAQRCAVILCIVWPEPLSVFFLKVLTRSLGDAELNTLSLKSLNLKAKHPVEVLDESKHG